ncbi:MAG TPA: non-reducing end alpha-L-arabinofuranosidase family hydrolase [Pseudonocardiaceae bacterium]|nr:non-reducing end alpha-L-arabinofuranosidase family hydrolase [Pseudonocardiaceae bacterium]
MVRRWRLRAVVVLVAAAAFAVLTGVSPAAADSGGAVGAVGAGKCLAVPNSSTTPGTQVQISGCDGAANQIWTYQSQSRQLTVDGGSGPMCLDANGQGTSPGTKVQIWTCNGQANQQWTVNANGTITGVQSGLCLDVTGASTSDGAPVELWTCNGGSNQQWTLGSSGQGGALPSSFRWSSSGVLISPHPDAHDIIAVKDPSVVSYHGQWYVAASTVNSSGGYGMEFVHFSDWSQANSATPVYADQTAIGGGYQTAPQLFYFAPQHLWYLIYQTGNNAGYSTNSDITNPYGWSATKYLYPGEPTIVSSNGSGWLDFFLICDSTNCYLFSMNDNGYVFRSRTSVSDFPNGMGNTVIALSDPDKNHLFEADDVYKVAGSSQYLLIAEAIGSDGHRYFTSYTTGSLAGAWTPLANTESNPFIRSTNVTFGGTAWSDDFSSGEMIRSGYDQTLTINPCRLQFLYQGFDPNANTGGGYNSIPWRIGRVTQTNSTC